MTLRSSRQPHEIALVIATFIGGLAGLLFYNDTASLTLRAFPLLYGYGFYVLLTAGSAVTLLGMVWTGIRGAVVERAGLLSLSLIAAGYGVAVFALAGSKGTGFVLFMAAFGIANVIRARQLKGEITTLVAANVLLREAPNP